MKTIPSPKSSYFHYPFLLTTFVILLSISSLLCVSAVQGKDLPEDPDFIFWEYDYEQALKIAKEKDACIFVYIYSNECEWCQKMDEDTFSHPGVVEFSRENVFLKLNSGQDPAKIFIEKYKIETIPILLVLSSLGSEVHRELDYLDSSKFLTKMKKFSQSPLRESKSGYKNPQSVKFYLEYAKKAFEHIEFMEATKALDYILYIDPNNEEGFADEALMLFGASLVYLYQLEAAEILLARLLMEYPKSRVIPDAMYILGEIYLQTNRVERANTVFKTLIERFPKHAMTQRARKSLQRDTGGEKEVMPMD